MCCFWEEAKWVFHWLDSFEMRVGIWFVYFANPFHSMVRRRFRPEGRKQTVRSHKQNVHTPEPTAAKMKKAEADFIVYDPRRGVCNGVEWDVGVAAQSAR